MLSCPDTAHAARRLLSDRIGHMSMLIIGFLGSFVAYEMLGPSPVFTLSHGRRHSSSTALVFGSLVVLGIFGAAGFVPVTPVLLDYAKRTVSPHALVDWLSRMCNQCMTGCSWGGA